ncbi:hypothetical protein D3C87_1510990 [compost metagenome]
MRFLLFFFLISPCGIFNGQAQQKLAKADPDFHLYLLVGQSNMAGRGKIDSISKQINPQMLLQGKLQAHQLGVEEFAKGNTTYSFGYIRRIAAQRRWHPSGHTFGKSVREAFG